MKSRRFLAEVERPCCSCWGNWVSGGRVFAATAPRALVEPACGKAWGTPAPRPPIACILLRVLLGSPAASRPSSSGRDEAIGLQVDAAMSTEGGRNYVLDGCRRFQAIGSGVDALLKVADDPPPEGGPRSRDAILEDQPTARQLGAGSSLRALGRGMVRRPRRPAGGRARSRGRSRRGAAVGEGARSRRGRQLLQHRP